MMLNNISNVRITYSKKDDIYHLRHVNDTISEGIKLYSINNDGAVIELLYNKGCSFSVVLTYNTIKDIIYKGSKRNSMFDTLFNTSVLSCIEIRNKCHFAKRNKDIENAIIKILINMNDDIKKEDCIRKIQSVFRGWFSRRKNNIHKMKLNNEIRFLPPHGENFKGGIEYQKALKNYTSLFDI